MWFSKIVNKFWNTFEVPDWRAEEMIKNKEISIKDVTPITVEYSNNTQKPQTKEEFESSISGTKVSETEYQKNNLELENERLKQEIEDLKKSQNPVVVSWKVDDTDLIDTSKLTIKQLSTEYQNKFGKEVPNNKKNDIEWIKNALIK